MLDWKHVGHTGVCVLGLHGPCVRALVTLALCAKLELDRTRGIRLFN